MRTFFSAVFAGVILLLTSVSAQADTDAVKNYVSGISKDVYAVLDAPLDDGAKQVKLEEMFRNTVDTDWLGRFVLGVEWRRIDPDKQKQYLSLYRDFLVKNYTSRFREYTGETFDVTEVRDEGSGEYTVSTRINRPGKENVNVDYRVRAAGKGYKVFDIIVEGVSLLTTQRAEFTSIVSRKGIDYLIEQIDARIREIAAKPEAAKAIP